MKLLQIEEYPDYYVSDEGNIYSCFNNKMRLLKPKITKIGYLQVCLYNQMKKRKYVSVHRLVAKAFIPNPENNPQVNHRDGNKQNNAIANLEWVTSSENIVHSYKILKRKPTWKNKKGRENPNSKIVIQLKDTNSIAEFENAHEVQRKLKIPASHVCDCCLGKRKTAGGFSWKYKNE